MATTDFTDNITPIPAAWLNDVDDVVYFLNAGTGGVRRLLNDRLKAESVNLFDFFSDAQKADVIARTAISNYAGAVDVTTAFQAALDHLRTSDNYYCDNSLYVPMGAYKITTTLSIPAGLRMFGDGRGNTRLIYNGASSCLASEVLSSRTYNISISDMDIFITNVAAKGILLTNCISATLSRLYIEGPNGATNATTGIKSVAASYDSFFNTFEDVWVNHCLVGFHVDGGVVAASQHSFRDCQAFGDFGTHALESKGFYFGETNTNDGSTSTIFGGYVEGCKYGLYIGGGPIFSFGTAIEMPVGGKQILFTSASPAGNVILASHALTYANVVDNTTHKNNTVQYTDYSGAANAGLRVGAGISAGGGFAVGTVYHTGGLQPPTTTTGTDSTPVVTETYIAEVFIPATCTLTGISVLNGSAVAGNIGVALADSNGVVVASTAAAGVAASGTAAYQKVPFSATYQAQGPAKYFVLLQANNTGYRFRSHALGNFGGAKKTGETFGTWTTVTAPTTFTAASLPPIADVY